MTNLYGRPSVGGPLRLPDLDIEEGRPRSNQARFASQCRCRNPSRKLSNEINSLRGWFLRRGAPTGDQSELPEYRDSIKPLYFSSTTRRRTFSDGVNSPPSIVNS